jgi:MtN3 and saliva related transmembrane protein
MLWSVIGTAAAALTMLSFVPQIIKVVKTRHVKDVSLVTLCQLALGVSLWIAYGVHLKNLIIIAANTVTLASMVILLYLYFKYERS